MKEKQFEMYSLQNKANELKEMDDISIAQYITQGS